MEGRLEEAAEAEAEVEVDHLQVLGVRPRMWA